MRLRDLTALASLIALVGPGCAEEASPGRNDPVPPACEGRQYKLTVSDPPTGVLRLPYNQQGTVGFKYADCDDVPLVGLQVNFSAIGATGGALLQAASGTTDSEGVAVATILSKDAESDFELKASALNAPDVSARISVRSKDGGDLEVRLLYRGRKQLTGARVMVVSGTLDCDALDPAAPPTALELKDLESLRDKARFTLGGEPQVSIVAIGNGSTPAPAAIGCEAGPIAIRNSATEVRDVELFDVPPSYSGTYDVTNNFNLVETLPEGVRLYIEELGNLFQDPGATAVDWLGRAPGVPNIPDFAGDLIADLANQAFESYTEGTAIGDAFNIGREVDDILRQLEILSTLDIKAEPGEDGTFAAGSIEERWDSLVINWTTGVCEGDDAGDQCGRNEFTWGGVDAPFDPVSAEPTGSIDGDNPFLLTIDPHGVKFDYGAVALFVIEKVVLPRTLGYDSFDDFIYELLGGAGCLEAQAADPADDEPAKVCCRAFSESITEDEGFQRDAVRGLCNHGVGPVIDLVKGRVETLEADSGENMTIGTKNADGSVNKPCEMFDADADNQVEALGAPPGKRCEWQVEIQRAEGEPIDFTGAWHGVKR